MLDRLRSARLPLLAGATLMLVPMSTARGQTNPPAPAASPSPQTQLDRIEGKLDEILRRLPPPTPGQTAALPAPAEGPPAPSETDQPGLLALARPAPHDQRSLPDVPADSVGGFVYAGGPLPLSDPSRRGVVHYTGAVGYELQGWMRAREQGRYQLAADLTARYGPGGVFAPDCSFEVWLEGHSLGQQHQLVRGRAGHESSASLVLGADLSPGLYKLRAWLVCLPQQDVVTSAELLLKAPSELNLRTVTARDLLHKAE